MVSCDPFNFGIGEFYLLKNEKMIILLQILERGQNYVVFTIKGGELQETTVCHAEENERIIETTEIMFEKKERPLNYLFSLSGLSQINFDVYDDQKSNMTGLIDNRDFAEMVKRAYMRAVFQKLRDLFKKRP